jgi:hypothetical protein
MEGMGRNTRGEEGEMKNTEAIAQVDDYGCSIACLAYLKHITYEKAYEYYFSKVKGNRKTSRGYNPKNVIAALKLAGKKYYKKKESTSNKIKDLPLGTIIFAGLPTKEDKKNTHYMIISPKHKIMDPYGDLRRNKPESIFRNKIPKNSYIKWLLLPETNPYN